MRIVIENGHWNSGVIGRGLIYLTNSFTIWDRNVRCPMDMIEDIKPDIIFFCNEVSEKFKNRCSERNICLVNLNEILLSDPLFFRKVQPEEIFVCDCAYLEIFNHDKSLITSFLSEENKETFRVYSRYHLGSYRWCGPIREEDYNVALCSAKRILCINEFQLYNYIFCQNTMTVPASLESVTYENSLLLSNVKFLTDILDMQEKFKEFYDEKIQSYR